MLGILFAMDNKYVRMTNLLQHFKETASFAGYFATQQEPVI